MLDGDDGVSLILHDKSIFSSMPHHDVLSSYLRGDINLGSNSLRLPLRFCTEQRFTNTCMCMFIASYIVSLSLGFYLRTRVCPFPPLCACSHTGYSANPVHCKGYIKHRTGPPRRLPGHDISVGERLISSSQN